MNPISSSRHLGSALSSKSAEHKCTDDFFFPFTFCALFSEFVGFLLAQSPPEDLDFQVSVVQPSL